MTSWLAVAPLLGIIAMMMSLSQLAPLTVSVLFHDGAASAIVPLKLGGQVIENKVVFAVLAFLFVYVWSIVSTTLILSASGLDIVTAFSPQPFGANSLKPSSLCRIARA